MGANTAKVTPQQGAIGLSQGSNVVSPAQAPVAAQNVLAGQQAQDGTTPKQVPLAPGQAPPPVLGTPLNPWGPGRGGNAASQTKQGLGYMPLYRRM